jgi:hypothetical protein
VAVSIVVVLQIDHFIMSIGCAGESESSCHAVTNGISWLHV